MLQSRPAHLPCGSDALLVVACKLFQGRLAAFAAAVNCLAVAESDRAGDDEPDRLRRQTAELRVEWQALGRGIAAAPAVLPAGVRAKADALDAYFRHVGGTEGIEIDLARSLVADLRGAGGEEDA